MAPSPVAAVVQALDTHFVSWAATLTRAERAYLALYQGYGFERINRILRHPSPLTAFSEEQVRQTTVAAEHLDAAIAKGTLPQAMTVYRGLTSAIDTFGFSLETGIPADEAFTEDAYMSTSLDREVALRKAGTSPHGVLIEFDIPVSFRAAWMPLIKPVYRSELELLLPRGVHLTSPVVSTNDHIPVISWKMSADE